MTGLLNTRLHLSSWVPCTTTFGKRNRLARLQRTCLSGGTFTTTSPENRMTRLRKNHDLSLLAHREQALGRSSSLVHDCTVLEIM